MTSTIPFVDEPVARIHARLRDDLPWQSIPEEDRARVNVAQSWAQFAEGLRQLFFDKYPTSYSEVYWVAADSAEAADLDPKSLTAFEVATEDDWLERDLRKKFPDLLDHVFRDPYWWVVYAVSADGGG